MRSCAALFALAAWLLPLRSEQAGKHAVPSYTQSSIVNAASNLPGGLAPNTIASLYGTGLAVSTRAVTPADVADGRVPSMLPGTGARVIIGGLTAPVYYASPGQINFVVPPGLTPGVAKFQVLVDGRAGPAVDVRILPASPAVFVHSRDLAAATTADGSIVTRERPAEAGGWVVFYATGLGRTNPMPENGAIVPRATPLDSAAELKVRLGDGDAGEIGYAGLAPGFAGLYQINVRLREDIAGELAVRLEMAGEASPAGIVLPVVKPEAPAARPSR